MLLEEWIHRRGGVAHSSTIYRAGFSKHAVATSVRSGALVRVRRSWLVLSACEPERLAAARVGGRLTCVSAARLMDLWVPAHDAIHVAVNPTAARFDAAGLRVHWSTGPAPIVRRTAIDPLLNVLYQAARCLPPPDALAVWESAIRRGLVAGEVLQRVEWRSRRAHFVAGLATALSDSGLETHFVVLMREIGVDVRQQVWIDGHRVDALIGDRLIVQLDGFAHHSSASDRRRDITADARLVLRGYTVLRFDYQQLLLQPLFVQDAVRAAMAQGLHRSA